MTKITVVNIKCGGCSKSIEDALQKAGMTNVMVDQTCQLVEFDGDRKTATEILSKMGYPEAGTIEAESLLKKAKSFVSCMVGRTKK